MKKTLVATGIGVIALFGLASPASASEEPNGPTVGNCISDIVYGNEPNEDANGNTVATQSPGPFVNNPNDPTNPTRGRSVGQFQQDGIPVAALCQAYAGK